MMNDKLQPGMLVMLKVSCSTVDGRPFVAGQMFVVFRRFGTTAGERIALSDDQHRVLIPSIRPDRVQPIRNARDV